MDRIFIFIYQYRAFFTFLVLEVFCAWLIVENNQYQGAQFFNSSNSFVASINGFSHGIREYFSLRDVNRILAEENALLRKKLEQRNQSLYSVDTREIKDPQVINRFDFASAKVVNNSIDRLTNFITIDKGSNDGIVPGMAVISAQGVVGKVKTTSPHYSVVMSLLNVDLMVSAMTKRSGYFGTIQWDGVNPGYVNFNFIPRHADPVVGDSVVTTGYGGVFPEGIFVGTISEVELLDEAAFFSLRIKLAMDFHKLSYVSVIKSNLLPELDSLELIIPELQR